MEKHLVNQSICLELGKKFLLAQQALFKKGKCSINPVVRHGSIHQVMIMGKATPGPVGMNKVHPVFIRMIENKAIQSCRQDLIKIINIHKADDFT